MADQPHESEKSPRVRSTQELNSAAWLRLREVMGQALKLNLCCCQLSLPARFEVSPAVLEEVLHSLGHFDLTASVITHTSIVSGHSEHKIAFRKKTTR